MSSDHHDDLRALVRRFLEERSPSNEVRRLMDSPDSRDDQVWTMLAAQLGLTGLVVPEEHGGAGHGPVELGIVMEEMGRALLVAPYFSTALAAMTLAWSGDQDACARWLPGIAAGTVTGTVALDDAGSAWDPDAVAARAHHDGEVWRVSGEKRFVVDGHSADLLLVAARAEDEVAVFAVAGEAPGLTRTKLDYLDRTRDLASVSLRDAPAVRIAGAGPHDWLDRVYDLALTALASEQVGGAARCLELAVEHAKLREQFGRPIGSFQAIKHKCAVLLLEVESSRSAAYHANAAVAAGDEHASVAAALANCYSAEAFVHAAKECIQIHGGIGYTWEHDAHLYLRRAKSSELLFGAPASQRSRLADLVGI
ncbi:acyl-CoA/acyl-ACP dehydrogenase [Nocardioides sp. cx-169]|uniref:acyl-CoA dehydrogenase family protein n=1 Tax=Nocardioides sp. cx-169 TaxID=2899080 RepID=UPI001E3F336F|nr:acyl-CoA dehydrogenase family protein [Nocardioides sp. cx-169]MCD4533050.1 acyl-CoA/acyl-ACP dehydrogenase [Nocardioides sp. cx-169]